MENSALWTRDLERFVKFRIKDRADNGAPLVLNNSQFVIDGVVMAINDHPERYRQSFTALNNLLRSRFEALENGTRSVDSASIDLYLTWCVFDAVCKATVVLEMVQLASDALPFLVTSYMPLWGDSVNCTQASLDHGTWYWNMIRSWICVGGNNPNSSVFSTSAIEACHHAIIQRFGKTIALNGTTGVENSHDSTQQHAAADLAEDDQALPVKETPQSQAPVGVAAINRILKDFKALRDTVSDGRVCVYCGATFASEAARVEHRQFHIGMVRQNNTAVEPTYYSRYLQPSTEDFVRYHAGHADGKHTFVCGRAGEMTKKDNSRLLLRRDENEIVIVDDPSVDRFCSLCYARFDFYQDTVSRKYALLGAVTMRNANNSLMIVHEACVV
eukprot:Tbor_TRINITY_DN5257_c1_g2::TRINITY_DN5257_c1_g2_i1::g.16178::m.16178